MEQKGKELRQRAEQITAQLTLEEKIGMIHGAQLFQTAGVERLGIPPLKMSDGPMGVRQEFGAASWIPVGNSDDFVTYLPCNSALAATWNRKLAYEMGSVLGEEARGRGKDVILAPGVNIKRSPLCGRNFEYFSEDPYLTKELAVPYIQGVQNWDVAACVKHFAVNNQETERLWVEVEVDEKALREIYLPAFHDCLVKAGSYTVMGAYNKIRGEHCCQSSFLLEEILRREWGYDGVVISDWGAVHDTKAAAQAPLDIEMSVTFDFDDYFLAKPLKEKVENGEIEEARIDEKVIHILMLMQRLHMLDGERKSGSYNTPAHRQTALEVARESVVLLKNEAGRLPLSAEKAGKILLIGDNAESIHSNGGGSAEIRALYEISPLMGVKKLLGGNAQVDFLRGYIRDEEQTEGAANWQETSLENGGGQTAKAETAGKAALDARRKALRQEAVERAGDYDTVIFIGGLNHHHDSEGNDRADMKLPYEQDLLIRELLAVRPDLIVVMLAGSPVEMGAWLEQVPAVVWSWYAGMEGGTALAEVLFGRVNPSGKLPESFYRKHTDCSAHCVGEFPGGKTVAYREGIYVGYRYLDTCGKEPEFCFGHGLSYTSFAYGEGSLEQQDGQVFAVCRVENTGARAGAETVQVYVTPAETETDRPAQELKGFEKVYLEPGESRQVRIPVEDWKEGRGTFIGASSRDIRIRLQG